MIDLTCGCGKQYRVPEQLAGERACCACGRWMSFPTLSTPPAPPQISVAVEPHAPRAAGAARSYEITLPPPNAPPGAAAAAAARVAGEAPSSRRSSSNL
ncbi:MAG TPA: hypothetical protein VER17_18900, partial [Tepidisphaeraceae bacterium]|nr:hypothetical protein [Tepidisphaeraceae bacterium]